MGFQDKTTADRELDFFKRQPLDPLLLQLGFSAKETANAAGKVTERSFSLGNVKLKTFKGNSGHYMWKSHNGSLTTRFGKDSGTVVDVAVHVCGGLAQARERLRALTGSTYSTPSSYSTGNEALPPAATHPAPSAPSSPPLDTISTGPTAPPPPTPDELFSAFRAHGSDWTYDQPVPEYLRSRNLTELHPLFSFSFRVSESKRGTLAFPYVRYSENGEEFAGYEKKNTDFKGFSKGGRAGVWLAACMKNPRVFVVAESPIDAMSYARLAVPYDEFDFGFMALRSGAEDVAVRHLRERVLENGLEEVVLATDNDAAGMAYAARVMSGLHDLKGRVSVRYVAPLYMQKDWNDALSEHLRRKVGAAGEAEPHPAGYDPSACMGF